MNIQEQKSIKGQFKILQYRAGTHAEVLPLMKFINNLLKKNINGKNASRILIYRDMVARLLKQNQIADPIVSPNLIMQAANLGMDLIIQQLNGYLIPPANPIAINYLAIGTGTTAPALNDTKLTTETTRSVVIWSQDMSYNELQMQTLLSDANLANQTYYEAGAFINGTAVANSGLMFDHALLSPPNGYAKTAGVDTTLELDITFINN